MLVSGMSPSVASEELVWHSDLKSMLSITTMPGNRYFFFIVINYYE